MGLKGTRGMEIYEEDPFKNQKCSFYVYEKFNLGTVYWNGPKKRCVEE
ncbi:hypothetical protein SAMN04488156_1284 [Bacillus sp. 166amftsu]|nr:hypothetical protein SAMN04488156_1284 [Bacillus sp. 166amftsu]